MLPQHTIAKSKIHPYIVANGKSTKTINSYHIVVEKEIIQVSKYELNHSEQINHSNDFHFL